MTTLGNIALLQLPATGFFCSRTTASRAILRVLDWALAISKDAEACVMSTFHSPLEAEALKFLLRGKCRVILVLGRTPYKKIPETLQSAIDNGRLLIVSLADQGRISRTSAQRCNEYIAATAHSLTFGFIAQDSPLNTLKSQAEAMGKAIALLTPIENININPLTK